MAHRLAAMRKKLKSTTLTITRPDQRAALASPLRLEIIGLFTGGEPLAIADMAALMGRQAGSLYHHVGILERAGLLRRTGTRPKGKRHEALFLPAASRIEMAAPRTEGRSAELILATMATAFRMAERDLEAAIDSDRSVTDGPERNALAARFHVRASPRLLARINRHLDAIVQLLDDAAGGRSRPSPADQHLSLTLALLPLKGRNPRPLDRKDRCGRSDP